MAGVDQDLVGGLAGIGVARPDTGQLRRVDLAQVAHHRRQGGATDHEHASLPGGERRAGEESGRNRESLRVESGQVAGEHADLLELGAGRGDRLRDLGEPAHHASASVSCCVASRGWASTPRRRSWCAKSWVNPRTV